MHRLQVKRKRKLVLQTVCVCACVYSTSLMAAAEHGHHGVCDYFIARGADVTLVDKHGMLSTFAQAQHLHATL